MIKEEAIEEIWFVRNHGYVANDSIIGTARIKESFDMAIEALKEPVRHGHWELAIEFSFKRKFMCSECRKMAYETSSYCPACGAKMDERVEND